MQLQSFNCRNCAAPIPADNFVERLAMARCSHCDSVFSLASRASFGPAAQPIERPEVEMPKGIRLEESGGELAIHRRWLSWGILFLAVFACFWNGFMIVWHTIALSQGVWIMSLFGLIHTAVGVGIGYVVLAGLLNTTTIRVGRGYLSIQHHPLPWTGNKTLTTDDIEQFYCKEKISRNNNGTSYRYVLKVVKASGKHEKLLSGIDNVEQALYIEQEIERFLEIEDAPVGGEYPRG